MNIGKYVLSMNLNEIELNNIYWDLNSDGVVNLLDIIIYVNNKKNYQINKKKIADINGDGIINILDILLLVNKII